MEFEDDMIDNKTVIPLAENLDKDDFFKLLRFLDQKYYGGVGLITDEVYDILLDLYEEKYGPYEQIGAEPKAKKVKLPYYLNSLKKYKTEKEVNRWIKNYPGSYLIEDKIDGLTLLYYTENNEKKLYTKGKKDVGNDVTHLLKYLNLPDIEGYSVRGEIVMNKDKFETLSDKFRNARNLTSGIINTDAKNVNPELASKLDFYAFQIVNSDEIPSDQIVFLRDELNFKVPNPMYWDEERGILTKDILENYYLYRKKQAPYEMDGLVIYQDVSRKYPIDTEPKHVIAFKIPPEANLNVDTAITYVEKVDWVGSKNKLLKPVVIYEKVVLSGAELKRASGYNARFIEKNQIGLGAKILIARSGDVIPKIIKVLEPSDLGPSFPNENEHGLYDWDSNNVELVLIEDNPDVIVNRLKHFANILDIQNLGSKRIKLLVNQGVNSINDLLSMNINDFMKIEGFGKKLSETLFYDIHHKIKNIPLAKALDVSGLFPNIGEKRFQMLLNEYPDILTWSDSTNILINMIKKVKGFNQISKNIATNLPNFLEWLENHPEITILMPEINNNYNENSLNDQTFVFSGFRDKNLETEIKNRGGKVSTSVSKNTTMVIMKDINDIKSKAEKALSLNIPLINKDDFIEQYI